jgi:hypothetical protein
MLTRDAERLPARRHERHARTESHQGFGQARHRRDEMFTIVENQKQPLVPNGASDGLGRDGMRPDPQPQHPSHGGQHKGGIGQ